MISKSGYFLIWRELFIKPIWLNSTLEQQIILITLMSMANWKCNQWEWNGEKYNLKPGQFITSAKSIIESTSGNVSRQNVRTALVRFKKLEFLTIESTKQGSLITLTNWQDYQLVKGEPNHTNQPKGNQRLTTIEESNKINNKKDTYTRIFKHWLLQDIIRHKKLTSKIKKAIDKSLKEYSIDKIEKAITVYAEAYHSDYYYNYKHSLEDFLKQKNGVHDWLEESSKFENYMDYLDKQGSISKVSNWDVDAS